MADTFDVVVIGSGHNGLIAGAYLAKGGQKVLILEGNNRFGGGVYTDEVAAPGFLHDRHSAQHVFIQANPLLGSDELGLKAKYGLKYVYPEGVFSTVFDDHTYIVSYKDLDKTCESIARISYRDAESYRRFAQDSKAVLPLIVQGMFVPPPPQGPFWSLLDQSPQGQDLMQAMQKSMLEIVDELFESEKVKLHLLKFAAELLVAPEEKGTGGILYYMPGYLHTYGIGIPVGGSSALVSALIKALTAHGASLRKDALVEKVLTEGGRAAGVRLRDGETIRARTCVIGQIHPWLLPDIVDGLDERVARNAKRTKTANFTVMVGHYALNEAPNYLSGNEPRNCTLTSFAPSSLHTYRRAFDEYRYGELPDVPIFSAHMMSQFDASRAPPGKHTLTIWRFAPFALRNGGAAAWEARRNFDDERTLAHLQYFAPNVGGANIVGRALDTPYDMLLHTPTFQNGDVGGIGKFFHQIGGHRPTPELSQYAVPGVERFYLTGTFMHPPGGITGGGRVTAMKICGDLGIDFDHLTR